MGAQPSVETNSEEKTVDTNGQVNNNIIIQEARDTHLQTIQGERLVYAAYILMAIELLKLAICTYTLWKRQMKKKYATTQARNAVP